MSSTHSVLRNAWDTFRGGLGLLGLAVVFIILLLAFIAMSIGRLVCWMMGWDIYQSRLQWIPWIASKLSWWVYSWVGWCRLTVDFDSDTFTATGVHFVMCDHPRQQLEMPVVWIATWRIMHMMIGSFDHGHLRWHPFAWGMHVAGMDLTLKRKHKKQRKQLTEQDYNRLAREAEEHFLTQLRFFDKLAGRVGIRLILHMFVNSRWTEERRSAKRAQFITDHPNMVEWDNWLLMPEVGGVFAARQELRNVSGWHIMVLAKQNEQGPDNWTAMRTILNADYRATVHDVTQEMNALPMTREATASWLAERFAPWAAARYNEQRAIGKGAQD